MNVFSKILIKGMLPFFVLAIFSSYDDCSALCVRGLPFASGHTLGQSLEKEVNGYVIDVGYDSDTSEISANTTTRMDFNLWTDKNKLAVADFSYVWVRIAPKESGITFAGFLHYPEPLLTGMSYNFQKAGEYELTVRFMDKQDKPLAEATFPLTVQGPKEMSGNLITGIIIGAVLGGGIAFFLMRRKTV